MTLKRFMNDSKHNDVKVSEHVHTRRIHKSEDWLSYMLTLIPGTNGIERSISKTR